MSNLTDFHEINYERHITGPHCNTVNEYCHKGLQQPAWNLVPAIAKPCVVNRYNSCYECRNICRFTEPVLDAGLLARSQYPEGPATGNLDTRFSWFPCVYKRMLRWFPSFQVATTCFSCSPPDLNFLVTYLIFVYMKNNHCHRMITQ